MSETIDTCVSDILAFAPSEPEHHWDVPGSDERLASLLRAIFSAEKKAPNGHDRIKDTHRALWLVTLFTAARPESGSTPVPAWCRTPNRIHPSMWSPAHACWYNAAAR